MQMRSRAALVVLMVVSAAPRAVAQSAIAGVIRDPSGAVLPGRLERITF